MKVLNFLILANNYQNNYFNEQYDDIYVYSSINIDLNFILRSFMAFILNS